MAAVAPPVDGLGNAGGFKIMVQDRGDLGLPSLQAQTDKFVRSVRQQIGEIRADTLVQRHFGKRIVQAVRTGYLTDQGAALSRLM